MWDLSSATRDQTRVPAVKVLSPNHWTTREFLHLLFGRTLGLCCCTRAFSSCSERGLLFIAVCGLLTAAAPPVVPHRL